MRAQASAGAIDPDLLELFADLVHQGVHKTEPEPPDAGLAKKQAVTELLPAFAQGSEGKLEGQERELPIKARLPPYR